jgi:hypothetical protein
MYRARTEPLLLVAAAFFLAILRSPLLLFHGRVYAEEGTVYLQQAWDASPLATLTAVHQGYYSLFMNLLALVTAKLVPLEWVGFTLTAAALAVLLLTVYLAATCEAFHDARTRLLAAAVCVLTPAIEVWLTAEDAQFYLPICVALICLSSEQRHRIVRTLTLLLAGLTGPVSCVLTPFYLVRAHRRRTPWAYLQAAILVACSTVQGLILLHTLRSGTRSLGGMVKAEWFGPLLFLKIFSVMLLTRLGAFAAQHLVLHHPGLPVLFLFWLLTLFCCALFWKLAKMGGEAGKLCFGMALASLAFNYIGIAEPLHTLFIGAFRYFFSGFALLSMVLVLASAKAVPSSPKEPKAPRAPETKLALRLICLVLASGAIDAAGYWGRLQRSNPSWRGQVAAWRTNPDTPIRVSPEDWPYRIHLQSHPHQP